jgi:hypothetical protein
LGRRASATRENETKEGQRDSHDASIKREVRLGVNRAARIGAWSNGLMEIAHRSGSLHRFRSPTPTSPSNFPP